MNRALIARRLHAAVQTPPAPLRWLTQCEPEVIGAYRAARRSLFIFQLPTLALIAAVAFPLKVLRVLPAGHPLLVALFLLGLTVLAWSPGLLRFAQVAWRSAGHDPRFGLRLRVLAGVLLTCAAVYAVGLTSLIGMFAVSLLR